MGDLGTETSVKHHEHLKFLHIMDENFAEAVWQHVSGRLRISVTDLGHLKLALEAPPDTIVNTMRFSPVWLLENQNRCLLETLR